jgi:hypothetical protein
MREVIVLGLKTGRHRGQSWVAASEQVRSTPGNYNRPGGFFKSADHSAETGTTSLILGRSVGN